MDKFVNRKILYIIPVIFLLVLLFRIFYSYIDTKEQMNEFAQKKAQVLKSHAMAFRNYYQKLYTDKTILLNEDTLKGLPAYSSYYIDQTFSKNNPFNISLQTVSDRARNPKNMADKEELKAISYFKNNPMQKEYFSDTNPNFYQYASALNIEKKCLKCHALKEDAPIFIQKKYDKAYGYKLGELRGILSIKIPKDNLNRYFMNHFIYSVIYDSLLFIVLFLIIYTITKKTNSFLQKEVKIQTKKLEDNLVHERLTGLPNRVQLLEDIKNSKLEDNKHLALINIDNFKDINDFYGHSAGDILLIQLGIRIHEFYYDEHFKVYKLPSDEYAVFSSLDISSKNFSNKISVLLQEIQKKKYLINGNEVSITIRCGIVSNEDNLVIKADMALQVAKDSKSNLVIYDDLVDTTQRVNENIHAIALLKDAIATDKLQPYFQAIYNTHTKKVEKYESLVRIITDNGDMITPDAFLGIATRARLYHHITYTMIEKTFKFFENKEEFEFSINLSLDDILNEKTVAFILDKLSKYSTSHRVVFEILESNEIKNYEEVKKFIQKVKKYKCKIAIDDFGSGYSNFSHLLELDADYLKIDASLIKNITSDENARKITKTIIMFSNNIGLKTIAEYVEDKESLDLLVELGIDFIQGYYIGKPSPKLL